MSLIHQADAAFSIKFFLLNEDGESLTLDELQPEDWWVEIMIKSPVGNFHLELNQSLFPIDADSIDLNTGLFRINALRMQAITEYDRIRALPYGQEEFELYAYENKINDIVLSFYPELILRLKSFVAYFVTNLDNSLSLSTTRHLN